MNYHVQRYGDTVAIVSSDGKELAAGRCGRGAEVLAHAASVAGIPMEMGRSDALRLSVLLWALVWSGRMSNARLSAGAPLRRMRLAGWGGVRSWLRRGARPSASRWRKTTGESRGNSYARVLTADPAAISGEGRRDEPRATT